MRIFLAGSTSFLAGHVLMALKAAKHDVTPWSRKDGPLPERLREYDAIYNCVGVLGKDGIPARVYVEAHVNFPSALIERMRPDALLVHMSTAYVTAPTSHAYYKSSKIAGETVVRSRAKRHCIVRPGPLFGPGDLHHLPLFRAIRRLGWFCPIPGKALICPTYAPDLAAFLARQLPNGTLTIAGDAVHADALMEVIADVEGVPRPWIHSPVKFKRDFFGTDHAFASDPYFPKTGLHAAMGLTVAGYKRAGLLN